jgi:glycosyltransferase involved in cell wall biosynthesis
MVPQFDIVHLHSVFLWPTWAAAIECRKCDVPYFISPRGMMVKELVRLKSPLVKSAWIRLIERTNLERAAGIHVTANIEAMELERFGFSLPPVINIPNGVGKPSNITAELINKDVQKLCARQPLILYLGRINWKKNLLELVRAMSNVPFGHLGITGYDEDDHSKMLVDAAASIGPDRVTVLARPILGADKEALLRACKLFVLPSLSENFGNTVLEAAIHGKPVVVSEGAGAATLVRQHQCGIVCLPNAKSISGAIAEILGDLGRAKMMGERGREAASRDYTWSAIARRMSEEYEVFVKRPRPRTTANLDCDVIRGAAETNRNRFVTSVDPPAG